MFFLSALVLALAGVVQAQNTYVLLEEDFEGLPLGPNVEEAVSGDAVWTNIPPDGWFNDNSDVPGVGDPATDGVTEWAGWAFADKDWWTRAAEDQRRSEFTLGQGTVAIADGDEWDDAAHPAVPGTGTFDVWLHTRPIDVSNAKPGTIQLKFDSSWRPEYDSNYHQTANIRVSFDGGELIEILRWESDSASPNYKDDNSTNETIILNIANPAGAQSMVIIFGYFDAGNDWWWAIDNILITGQWSGVRAYNPSPATGSVEVPVRTTLGWTAGDFVGGLSPKHRIVLSDDIDAVANGTAIVATQDATSFNATGLLQYGTTYYWRVDEANSVRGWDEGGIWNFTTESFAYVIEGITVTTNAISDEAAPPQNTINGSGLNENDQHSTRTSDMWLGTPGEEPVWLVYEFDRVYKLHQMLVWNYNSEFETILGFGLKDVTVEYSQDGAEWTALGDVEFAKATSTATYAANTMVDFGGIAAKFVRLTVNSGWGATGKFGLSEVRFLFIPAHAQQPQPADGATEVEIDAALSWRGGREAVTHEVYLSTDAQAVADGAALAGSVGTVSYQPALMDFATTYYWRVDEVNEAASPSMWGGAVWSFTTAEYALVDGFESYTDDIDAGEAIFDTWLDGWVNNTGSTVGYLNAPFAEKRIVHSGRQSMPLQYDNTTSPFYSEAERIFASPQDWTVGGADSVNLYFRGAAENSAETLYVVLKDSANGTATVVHADAEAIQVAEWQQWRIPLSDFGGGNASRVKAVAIGVGRRTSPTAGGTGIVYIDDVGFGRPAAEQ
jgi:hypothetical protein